MSKRQIFDFGFAVLLFLFATWIMVHTLSYDAKTHAILLSSTVWSDFGAHLPLIRSFSWGANWPPESPLFPGEPIRYHFLFYAFVGLLERLGMRIDFAFNIPSIIGLWLLMIMLYITGKVLFRRRLIGILGVLFFLFNGSFSWISYFTKKGWTGESIAHIATNARFPSFGPWDGGLVTAFWNLNIYTNQRHLGLSYGLALLGIYILWTMDTHKNIKTRYVLGVCTGTILGILSLTNQAAFAILGMYWGWIFLTTQAVRLPTIPAFLISLPWIAFYFFYTQRSSPIVYETGYVIHDSFTWKKFGEFWLYNLGLHLPLIPLGLFFVRWRVKFFIIPTLVLFIAPNLWRFSVDMINNHKFFNFFLIIGSMYSAAVIVKIWDTVLVMSYRLSVIPKYIVRICNLLFIGLCIFSLTFSGIIDFFVIANDQKGPLADRGNNRDIDFFLSKTSADAIVLNSTWFYHPASLAGRKIYAGYAYFTWSYGYDKDAREKVVNAIYNARDKETACRLLHLADIDYVELKDKPEEYIHPNWELWRSIPSIYRNNLSGVTVYNPKVFCYE